MTDGKRPGSVEVAERRRGGLAWLWVLLGVLLLGLVAWLALGALGGDDDQAAPGPGEAVVTDPVDPAAQPAPATDPAVRDEPDATGAPEARSAAGEGNAAAGGGTTAGAGGDPAPAATGGGAGGPGEPVDVTEVVELLDRVPVAQLVDRAVAADSVLVQAVVADEAFYVGPGPDRAVLVRLPEFAGSGAAESPFVVTEGDRVSFTGTLAEIGEGFFAQLRQYDRAEGLEPGRVYVQARDLEIVG